MEKFLWTFKLSKGSIYIGWLKIVLSGIFALLAIAAMIFGSVLLDFFKNMMGEGGKTFTSVKFYIYIVLLILFLVVYGTLSFALIIGSINHDRLKVSGFLIADVVVTFALFYMFYSTFFNFFAVVILVIQLYLLFSVFSFWQQLRKENENRMENLENRRRKGQKQGYVRENAGYPEVTVGAPELNTVTENA